MLVRPGFSLVDRFGPSTADVLEARRLCAPTDKEGEDPTAPTHPDHLTGYRIKQQSPKPTRVRNLAVTNQFGPQVIDLSKADYLLVPSAKDRTSPPPLPSSFGVDHFKCYRAYGKLRRSGVQSTDQFQTLLVDLNRPLHFCAAADKNGGGIMNPTANLLCYRARSASFNPPGTVFINNQFGPDSFGLFRPTELCVPTTVP